MHLAILCGLVAFCGATENKIVGGSDAENDSFPYQVSLRRKGRHVCGGSIIGDDWILTAAHCIYKQRPEHYTVVAGSNLLDSGGDSYKVKELIPHENYDPETISNDIALIKLKQAIHVSEGVNKIELSTEDVPSEVELTLSGWGMTEYPGSSPNKLQTIKLFSITNEKCAEEHPYANVTASNICTFTKKGEGACKGDSGGPLVSFNKQVGVVSWGLPCAKGKPDVFTRVYSFLSWVADHTKSITLCD
ncbi:hypothetical protein RI129_011240 [Pyrocoelia pectoralis]|uniref:Peptidase S1 domain-containing protein n=1 Tax=Pyrocoelia pectoralis TaxID=417401 RepID=A0AAN7VBN3_9COLE